MRGAARPRRGGSAFFVAEACANAQKMLFLRPLKQSLTIFFFVLMKPYVLTIAMLVCSNCFMTYAWYGHLRSMNDKAWWLAALVSWGVALCEYMIMVPANRIGYTVFTLPQLKIIQEVITLSVFIPFSIFFMHQPLKLDYLWAMLCMLGAVYFMFRS